MSNKDDLTFALGILASVSALLLGMALGMGIHRSDITEDCRKLGSFRTNQTVFECKEKQ